MIKGKLMILLVILFPFTVQSSTFSKNLISKVVTWDEVTSYSPGDNEKYILSSLSESDLVIIGKIVKIDPLFPPHNAQPMGLVTIHVYEGEAPGTQIRFITHNVFFTCQADTPYPHCREDSKYINNLISVQSDSHPWVLPGDTVIVILRPYSVQLDEIEGETREMVYARFVRGEYDRSQDQYTYGQKLRGWRETFNNSEYLKAGAGANPYEFLNLTRQKDRKVNEIKKAVDLAD